jgi:hypothetical protein
LFAKCFNIDYKNILIKMFQIFINGFVDKWEFISNCAGKKIERGIFCGYIMRAENVYFEKHKETKDQLNFNGIFFKKHFR